MPLPGLERPNAPATGGHRLYTWSHRAALTVRPPGVSLVRISLGRPKFVDAAEAAAMPYVHELAPAGLLDINDRGEFDRRYRDRLDGFGVELIQQRLVEVAAAHSGLPLVLLCFERDRSDCHRGTFADWWLRRTGELVPEYG